MRKRKEEISAGYWPGVSDAMLGALMMVLLIAMGGLLLFTLSPEAVSAVDKQSKFLAQITALQDKVTLLEKENALMRKEVDELKKRLEEKNAQIIAANLLLKKKAPPIIEMADVTTMSFEPGSAALDVDFEENLKSKYFPQFVRILEEYDVVDTIEIIGHTDRTPVSSERKTKHRYERGVESSLDRDLTAVLLGGMSANNISQGSNADLGLMRSLAIQRAWKDWISNLPVSSRIKNITIRTYSAAFAVLPGIPPSDNTTEAGRKQIELFDKASRRIEVRFTRLNQK